MITYFAVVTMAFAVVITGVDAVAKMPTYWTLALLALSCFFFPG